MSEDALKDLQTVYRNGDLNLYLGAGVSAPSGLFRMDEHIHPARIRSNAHQTIWFTEYEEISEFVRRIRE